MDRNDARGQAHTLEAVVGAVLLLTAIAFALQVTVVTPLSASTSSQHIEGQQRAVAQGVLASAAEDGTLKDAVLYLNETTGEYHNTGTTGSYTTAPPVIRFGKMLERAFSDPGIAYNVYISYQTVNGGINQDPIVRQGTPSDNAVSATRTIVLRDNDRLVGEDGNVTDTTLAEVGDTIDINDPLADTPRENGIYNVVSVEVVAWRI
jgi:hypothetical protein